MRSFSVLATCSHTDALSAHVLEGRAAEQSQLGLHSINQAPRPNLGGGLVQSSCHCSNKEAQSSHSHGIKAPKQRSCSPAASAQRQMQVPCCWILHLRQQVQKNVSNTCRVRHSVLAHLQGAQAGCACPQPHHSLPLSTPKQLAAGTLVQSGRRHWSHQHPLSNTDNC